MTPQNSVSNCVSQHLIHTSNTQGVNCTLPRFYFYFSSFHVYVHVLCMHVCVLWGNTCMSAYVWVCACINLRLILENFPGQSCTLFFEAGSSVKPRVRGQSSSHKSARSGNLLSLPSQAEAKGKMPWPPTFKQALRTQTVLSYLFCTTKPSLQPSLVF